MEVDVSDDDSVATESDEGEGCGENVGQIETFVDFPLKSLDLTNYMPSPLPPGVVSGQSVSADDPRAQTPPYRYDLYGVTNHYGTLSSGHCKC